MALTPRFRDKQIETAAEHFNFARFRRSLGAMLGMVIGGGILTWIFITDGVRDIAFNLANQLEPLYLVDIGDLNEQQQNYVHKIITGVESMSHLVQNLLDLGRIEAEVGLKLDMISAPDIVSEVADSFKIRASQKKMKI